MVSRKEDPKQALGRGHAGGSPEASRLQRWGHAVARHNRVVLASWLALLVVGAILYPGLQSRLTPPDYSIRGTDAALAEELVASAFPALGAEQDVVVFRSARDVADAADYRHAVEAVLGVVRDTPGVVAVTDPYDRLAGGQVSADSHVALALVSLSGDASERSRLADTLQTAARHQVAGSGVEAYLTGTSPLNNDLAGVERHDQEIAESIGVPVALTALLVALGALVAAALPVVLALAAVLVCLGVLALAAGPLGLDQFATIVATMIGTGVGIDYALFIVTRFREELARGASPQQRRPSRAAVVDAVGRAVGTAGHTVVAAGLVVIVATGAMAVIRGHIFVEIALSAGLVVACCIVANLTLLPALLTVLGPRVNAGGLPRALRPSYARPGPSAMTGRWARWARLVLRHPVAFGLPALVLLCVAALPLASIRLGFDLGLDALRGTPSGRGADIVTTAFGPGMVAPVQVVACVSGRSLDTRDLHSLARLGESLRVDRRVAQVTSVTDLLDLGGGHTRDDLRRAAAQPQLRPALTRLVGVEAGQQCALVYVVLAVPVDSPDATGLVGDLRTQLLPAAFAATGARYHVGGLTSQYAALSAQTAAGLPVVIAIVLGLSLCYLAVEFRSILLPVKAVLLNLLATATALGLTVFVFQLGHGQDLFGFTSAGTVQAYLPVALFALLFGLSMDYEVFLVRRMREEWLERRDNAEAVVAAVAHTARPIMTAASIMVSVFGSFLVADVLELKQMGFALAVAILVDATIIRLLLVPAFMGIAGNANWWLPARPGSRRGPAVDAARQPTRIHDLKQRPKRRGGRARGVGLRCGRR